MNHPNDVKPRFGILQHTHTHTHTSASHVFKMSKWTIIFGSKLTSICILHHLLKIKTQLFKHNMAVPLC